jgi:hypothetical protein
MVARLRNEVKRAAKVFNRAPSVNTAIRLQNAADKYEAAFLARRNSMRLVVDNE